MREELERYTGSSPAPAGFWEYWQAQTQAAASRPSTYTLTPVQFGNRRIRYAELRFTGADGAEIYAKYLRPDTDEPVPLVLHFHDLGRNGEGWFQLGRYPAIGYAVLAMECRGQGNRSGTLGSRQGPTVCGPLLEGILDGPDGMYYRRVYLDACRLAQLARQLPGVDGGRLAAHGKGQGGGIALALAALDPGIEKCIAYNPYPADFRKVWELDRDEDLYAGLRYYFRWFDPLHRREEEILDRLGFIDLVNFAPHLRGALLLGTGLLDTLCPPATQYAVYHCAGGEKYHAVFPKYDHEFIFTFETLSLQFLAWDRGEPFRLEVQPE